MTRYGRDESEWLTRKLSIDPKLKSWGWTVIPFDSATLADQRGCYAIAEYPSANGPADYALVVNGRVLGIVEAKKLTLGPQGVLTQAERYARGLPSACSTFVVFALHFSTPRTARSFGFMMFAIPSVAPGKSARSTRQRPYRNC
jgi:type I restriction enzyme R subunit